VYTPKGITRPTVAGFKSISHEQSIEIRPLTILAGANSSGKSSIMQPLLLLKQTLEAPYDPGALLLDGPNVRFSSADQILSRILKQHKANAFHVGIQINNGATVTPYYSKGLGVSQTLPVLVALHVAENGQLLYLEQPELHLHPRAQFGLAEVLADAAMRGNHMVVETHSSLLLLGIQTLVAEGKLSPEMVKLHWFTNAEDGSTEITSADLDANGAFGDWPEDFAIVTLGLESRYLDAQSRRLER